MIRALNFRRILITRMKFIGDVVLTTPVVRSVRNAFPDAYLAYLGEKEAVSLLERNPCLDEIIPFDFSRPSALEQVRIARLLHRRRFDLAIDLFGNPRTALLTFLSGAPTRVGPKRALRGRLYTLQVADDGAPKSAIEFHNQFIRAVGIEPTARRTEIILSEAELEEARMMLRSGGDPAAAGQTVIGLHPGASWPAKRWLPERFAALADLAAEKIGAHVVVTAGPGDSDTVETVRRHARSDLHIVQSPSLRRLAAITAQCSAYVSNDAGPMHIAAAVGTPTIGLFGPGEEQVWFPYDRSEGHQVLRKDVPCHPCHLDFCNRKGDGFMECMKLLSVEDVFRAVLAVLH